MEKTGEFRRPAWPRRELVRGGVAALAVTAGLLFINWNGNVPAGQWVPAGLFCWLLHVVFFTVGGRQTAVWLRTWAEGRPGRFLAFPLLLAGLLYAYVLSAKGVPWHWPEVKPWAALAYLTAVPLAAVLPVLLFFRHTTGEAKPVGGWDFLLFAVAAGVAGGLRFPFDRLPVTGEFFETASRLTLLLTLVYATVVVRRLNLVGFNLSFAWTDLLLTLGCWGVMLLLFVALLYPAGLVTYVGYQDLSLRGVQSGTRYFLSHLFSVGVFEELAFRGIFQNMLAQKAQDLGEPTRKRLLTGGAAFFAVAALAATFLTANARFWWFPPLVVLAIFAATHWIEHRFKIQKGEYLVLAIISVVFGIAHYRFGEVFMGLACLAGWFDGFVYTKTKNVFLAALIHALLNCSAMFLGLHKNF
ncbi:MAG: CPBP family intramembrane glutamic endopeptidase [Lentisphaeria bacterium]